MRLVHKTWCAAALLLALSTPAHAAEAASEGGFFSDTWRQVTDFVSPSESGSSNKPRHATEQDIVVKGDVVGVDASNIATQVHIGSDDTVVLQGSDGRSVAPATELSAPEKKVETPAAKESSIWDDMVNAIGLGDDTPAEAPAAKK